MTTRHVAVQVLGASVTSAPSGLVMMLSVATIFMVDIGSKLSLPGWSGVVSVIAQYRADETYSSRVATKAVIAVRSGRANFASVRDLVGSTVPTVWYPLLALAAETSGREAGWGGVVCIAAVLTLLFSHGLKLQGYGFSSAIAHSKQFVMAFWLLFSPLSYRIAFYSAFSTIVAWVIWGLKTGSFFRHPDLA